MVISMSEYLKAILKRVGWTMAEAALAAIGPATMIEEINWKVVISIVLVSGLVCFLKCIVFGIPEIVPAEEVRDIDVIDEPVVQYPEEEYDDLAIDDDVDTGDEEMYDDEVE